MLVARPARGQQNRVGIAQDLRAYGRPLLDHDALAEARSRPLGRVHGHDGASEAGVRRRPRIPNIADRDDRDKVRPLMLHVVNYDWKDLEVGALQAYVCRQCGFTELYTAQPEAIPVDKIPGAKVLRAKS